MDRRSFLIGAGSILTSAYVEKANWFLTNRNWAVPLLKSNKDTTKLFFVNQGMEDELRLGSPYFGIEDLTYRQVFSPIPRC
jgi:hypothetical protein